jgi:acyl-CoA reductase-like NAD-dependent aldehyde dehydrogenase
MANSTTNEYLEVRNPATQEVIGQTPLSTAFEVAQLYRLPQRYQTGAERR